MRRWLVLGAVVALLVVAAVWASLHLGAPPREGIQPAAGDRRAAGDLPNIVLISLDTLRPDHLGCYGYTTRPTSPHLDRLAAASIRFERAWTQAPWTLPSHMSLFTSMLPSHNGVDNLYNVLSPQIPTLPQLLKAEGYHTAGIVNDGQMQAHWGFARGFEVWQEYPVDAPEGDCEHLTAEAIRWLRGRPSEPYFLFLHYYDVHDPYDAPPAWKEKFGVTLSREEADRLLWDFHWPDQRMSDSQRAALIAAYDAEIAWMDHELGKLFEAIGPDAWIIVFSDHGEAFEEHGWTWHGATLYEEEARVVLMMRPPAGWSPPTLPDAGTSVGAAVAPAGPGSVVTEPVMLMDVAPTLLSLVGAASPPTFHGADLVPLLAGQPPGPRLIPMETKAFKEGQLRKALVLDPWKLVYDLFHGSVELYKLPDEHADLAAQEPAMLQALREPMQRWVEEESFWLIYVHGPHQYDVNLELPPGATFANAIPLDFNHARDLYTLEDDVRRIAWSSSPSQGTRAIFLQPWPMDSPLALDVRVDGVRRPDMVFATAAAQRPRSLPAELRAPRQVGQSPLIEQPFRPPQPGLYAHRHVGTPPEGRTVEVQSLGAEMVEQLRSLGYLQ